MNGIVVYLDQSHLTATFAKAIAPVIVTAIRATPALAGIVSRP
jgi:hypothetical protein